MNVLTTVRDRLPRCPTRATVRKRAIHLLRQTQLLQDMSMYETYFRKLGEIHRNGVNRRRVIVEIKLKKYFILAGCIYVAFLALFQDQMSHYANLTQYNVAYMEGLRGHWNIWFTLFGVDIAFNYDFNYFDSFGGASCRLLYATLIKHKNDFFLRKHIETREQIRVKLRHDCQYRAKTISEYLRSEAIISRNLYQLLYITNVCHFIWCQIRIPGEFAKNGYFNDGYWGYLAFQFAGVAHLWFFHVALHIMTLGGSLQMLVMKAGHIKLSQMEQFGKKIALGAKSNGQYQVKRFLLHNNYSLILLQDFNRIFGHAFFLFLFINLPLNAMFVMMMALYELNVSLRMVFALFVMFQILFLFVIHLAATMGSVLFHKPARQLIKLSIKQSSQSESLRWRLKIAHYIQQFHTTNPYTVNYGKYGQITFASFGKHLLYYSKYLIFAYKIIEKESIGDNNNITN